MTAVLVLAVALVAGAPVTGVVAVAATMYAPVPTLVALVLLAVRGRIGTKPVDERVALLSAMSADLRAGRSLRHALVTAAGTDPTVGFGAVGRLAGLGSPFPTVVERLEADFGAHAPLVGAGLRLVDRTGAAGAEILDQAAMLIEDDLELAREVRAGSAPARVSAAVIGLAPVALVAWQLADGSLARAVAVPGGGLVVGLGGALLGAGIGVVFWLARRTR